MPESRDPNGVAQPRFQVGDRVRTLGTSPVMGRAPTAGIEYEVGRVRDFGSSRDAENNRFAYYPPNGLFGVGGHWQGELELALPTGSPARSEVTIPQGKVVEIQVKDRFYTFGRMEIQDDGTALVVVRPDTWPATKEGV